MKVGVIGCGNVGSILAERQKSFKIVAVYDSIPERVAAFSEKYGAKPFSDIDAFLHEPLDIVVEVASIDAVKELSEKVMLAGRDLILLSVGALADDVFRKELLTTAKQLHRRIHIPSGAIMGLDNVRVGKISRVDKLFLKTTKPSRSLNSNESVFKCLFAGKARDCVALYPKNTNVAISLSLACGREADVELWVDPKAEQNMHEIFFEGEFGDAYIRIRNLPAPENPATSYLAALSVLSLLESLESPLVIGA